MHLEEAALKGRLGLPALPADRSQVAQRREAKLHEWLASAS